MQHIQSTRPVRARGTRLVAGCGLLVVYLLAATPLAPLAVAAIGELDRNHHVVMRQSNEGPQVVLRHDCAKTAAHRHGLVAQALTLLARPPAGSDFDHVVQFRSATDAASEPPVPTVDPSDPTPAPEACLPYENWSDPLRLTTFLVVFPRPPPGADGRLLTVCSTVLLI